MLIFVQYYHLLHIFMIYVHAMCLFNIRYAAEVDVDFVRKSVRAIGRCAIKVESASERCVSTLVDLIQTKVQCSHLLLVCINLCCIVGFFFLLMKYLNSNSCTQKP